MLGRAIDAVRWRRILATSRLDPRRMTTPLNEPGDRDFMIAGCPRTGSSLMAAVLFQPPQLVTVMEPWDGLRLMPHDLFSSLRSEIQSGTLKRGRLDLDARARGEVRWHRDGEVRYPVAVDSDFRLGVKWPAFWQYLPMLPATKFVVTVRHPAEVVTSFGQQAGTLARGLDYDVPFNRQMNNDLLEATSDDLTRRVLLYEYVNSRLLPHLDRDNVYVARYERWFQDPQVLMSEIAHFLGLPNLVLDIEIRPAKPRLPSDELRRLIAEKAPSASALGYDL